MASRPESLTNVPRGDYLVTAMLLMTPGSGISHWGIGRANHGATPASPFLPGTLARVDFLGTGVEYPVTLTQFMRSGDYDDDGSTTTIDFTVYYTVFTGSNPLAGVLQWAAFPLTRFA